MSWRPVPDSLSSPAGRAPAGVVARAGAPASGTDLERAQLARTAVVSGLITQQPADHPGSRAGRGAPPVGRRTWSPGGPPTTGRSTRGKARADVVRPDEEDRP